MAKAFITNFRGEHFFTPNGKLHVKEEPVTPIEEDFGDHNKLDSLDADYGAMRKSLSMTDVASLKQDFIKLEVDNDRQDIYERYRKPTLSATSELSKTKFVSMAEAIYHFQRDTPGRFRTTRPTLFKSQGGTGPSGLTVPQSPMLRCKARSRPVHVISQKEKEEMEIEEMKKFKLKANPVPKSVITGNRNLPDVQRKPSTVPEPFKLTEVHKKTFESPQALKFKARPAPKHILEKPQVPARLPAAVTVPFSPKFHYKRSNSADHMKSHEYKSINMKTTPKPVDKPVEKPVPRQGPIRAEPFSFEKRDEELKRRREERIKSQIEEERKQHCQFKAQPLPGMIKKKMQTVTVKSGSSTTSSENKENYQVKFEARPPAVLYKEPFKPVLKPLQLVKPVPFALTTEKRAAEREKFDHQMKEKEEEQEKLRLLREKEQQEAMEKAEAELRAKLVHHPKPMPLVKKPFVPEKMSVPLTVPETPKFIRRLKQN